MIRSNLRCTRHDNYEFTHIYVHPFGIFKRFFVYLHTEVHFNDINTSMKAYTTKLQNKLLFLALILPSTSSLYNSIEVDIIRLLLAGCEATVAILIRWALGGLNKIEVYPNEKPSQSRWLLCAILVVYGMSYTCFNLDI